MTEANDRAPHHLLTYNQGEGFTAYGLASDFGWKEGEDDDEWLHRLGYHDLIWVLGSEDTACAYARRTNNAELPQFMVAVSDPFGASYVFVRDPGDLFALRLHVALLVVAEQGEMGMELVREQQKGLEG